MEITWDNFFEDYSLLIFRPKKQNSKTRKKGLVRKIKIPGQMKEEFKYYSRTNFFHKKQLFNFSSNSFRDRLNKKFRKELGGKWNIKSENIKHNKDLKLSREYFYTLRSFRTTCATIIYYYYSKQYGLTDMALIKTCNFMGHSHKFMTASHYIQRISDLGLNKYPNLNYFELIEQILYSDVQTKISLFDELKGKSENKRLESFDNSLVL